MEIAQSTDVLQAVSSPSEESTSTVDTCQIFDASPDQVEAGSDLEMFGADASSAEAAQSEVVTSSEMAAEVTSEDDLTALTSEIDHADLDDSQLHHANPFVSSVTESISESADAIEASPVETKSAPVTAQAQMIGADDRVSKRDLVSLLEGFVRIIKTDDSPAPATGHGINLASNNQTNNGTGTAIELARGTGMAVNEAHIDDRTVEIDSLRGLVIEAQDTIIKLLTDRVEDRSRIATLEAQLQLLPDLQAQADRAMSVAVRTEEYRTELTKMKFELDRFRLFRVRVEAENKKATAFNRIQKWLFSRPNKADETLQGPR